MNAYTMNSYKRKAITLALGLTLFSTVAAQAAPLVLGPDTNVSTFKEQYQYSNPAVFSNFTDYVSFEITSSRDLVATLSGTSDELINFSAFDLYSGVYGGVNTFVETGDVISPSDQDSSGRLVSKNLAAGSYFIQFDGLASGSSSYNGNITLIGMSSPVPEPESYAMLLAGLGLIGFTATRRKIG